MPLLVRPCPEVEPAKRISATALFALVVTWALPAGAVSARAAAPSSSVCSTFRNDTPGAPFPAEPNRADAQTAMQEAGDAATLNNMMIDNLPVIHARHADGVRLMEKIDREGTLALAALPASTPRIDFLINRHLVNLVWARSTLGQFYEFGRLGRRDPAAAVAVYQRAIDTAFKDDRGCVHRVLVHPDVGYHLAGMYIYGIGVPQDFAKARALFDPKDPDVGPIVTAIDSKQLPDNFDRFLVLAANKMIPPEIEQKRQLDEQTDQLLKKFHMQAPPTPIWLVVLLISAVASILVVIVMAIVREVRDKIRESGPPRNIFAVADLAQSAFARLDLFFKGLLVTFGALTTFYGFYGSGNLGVLMTSMLSGWFDYVFAGIMVVIVAQGIFSIIAAMRSHTVTPNSQAHGSARPATEQEARAAAFGTTKTADLHDRTFSD